MASFLDGMMEQFGGGAMSSIASSLGVDPQLAQKAVGMAAPAVLAAMAGKAQTPGGASDLMSSLGQLMSSGGGNLNNVLSNPAAQMQGNQLASNLFGDHMEGLESTMVRETGISRSGAAQVLGMATPAVMGAVGQQVQSGSLDAAGLTSFLGDQVQSLQKGNPGMMDMLGGLLGTAAAGSAASGLGGAASSALGAAAGGLGGNTMMTGLITAFGAPVIASLAKKFGVPDSLVKAAVPIVVALVAQGLARRATQPGGMTAIQDMMKQADQAGLAKGSVADYVDSADPAQGATLLKGLMGENRIEQVAANFGGKTGLSPEAAVGLMSVAGPAVLGQITQTAQKEGLGADAVVAQLSDGLKSVPNLGDVDYILDNQPGIGDDLSRAFKKFFG